MSVYCIVYDPLVPEPVSDYASVGRGFFHFDLQRSGCLSLDLLPGTGRPVFIVPPVLHIVRVIRLRVYFQFCLSLLVSIHLYDGDIFLLAVRGDLQMILDTDMEINIDIICITVVDMAAPGVVFAYIRDLVDCGVLEGVIVFIRQFVVIPAVTDLSDRKSVV